MNPNTPDKEMEVEESMVNSLDIAGLRRSYTLDGLLEEQLPDDPVLLFRLWFEQALKSEVIEPNAMTLSTVKKDGTPDGRLVLLKGVEDDAVTFYTNYSSDKADDLATCPFAACCFWWPELERQIRLRGPVERVSREESASYFSSRPRESQIGAWASHQSQEITSRQQLESRYLEIEHRFEGREIPLPEEWGGYRIRLVDVEFWQGRPGRLHDRIRYRLQAGKWKRDRLSP